MLNLRIFSWKWSIAKFWWHAPRIPRWLFFFAQIALAIGVLTSSWGGEGSQILWIRCGGGCHTGCCWRCRLVCRGQGSQIQDRAVWLYFISVFWFVSRNISMEEDLSCESAWNKWQTIADTFPFYLGSMLVFPFKKEKTWSGVSSLTAMEGTFRVYSVPRIPTKQDLQLIH